MGKAGPWAPIAFALLIASGCGANPARPLVAGGKAPIAAKARDPKLDTALIKALWERDSDAVKALLAKGADADLRDEFGYPVLVLAAGDGQTESVRALLDARADVKAKDPDSRTALMEGAESGVAEIVTLLLAKGAELDAQDALKWTALHGAAFYGKVDTVKALIAAHADVELKTDRGRTPQQLAEEMGYKEVVALLELAKLRILPIPRS